MVVVVGPQHEAMDVHDGARRTLHVGATLTHEALPGFALDLDVLFAREALSDSIRSDDPFGRAAWGLRGG
ncbi:hypothetical protein WPS_07460 [Vulcanimicrobium alpinum]|uniref:Uncharacterized protein n=1 Tax=Vulcanimicrobium alpinum TaxID=3016050 RepID=A0AAN1XV01_UNVUL|nr:hypothetical protein [Vulcanimicrobium alpinum]BDE05470.1 hypothetical protein WPS_07460 [Vulcanimicrobium alpinum]